MHSYVQLNAFNINCVLKCVFFFFFTRVLTIQFHMENSSMDILLNFLFCCLRMKESHRGLKQHEDYQVG